VSYLNELIKNKLKLNNIELQKSYKIVFTFYILNVIYNIYIYDICMYLRQCLTLKFVRGLQPEVTAKAHNESFQLIIKLSSNIPR